MLFRQANFIAASINDVKKVLLRYSRKPLERLVAQAREHAAADAASGAALRPIEAFVAVPAGVKGALQITAPNGATAQARS